MWNEVLCIVSLKTVSSLVEFFEKQEKDNDEEKPRVFISI